MNSKKSAMQTKSFISSDQSTKYKRQIHFYFLTRPAKQKYFSLLLSWIRVEACHKCIVFLSCLRRIITAFSREKNVVIKWCTAFLNAIYKQATLLEKCVAHFCAHRFECKYIISALMFESQALVLQIRFFVDTLLPVTFLNLPVFFK